MIEITVDYPPDIQKIRDGYFQLIEEAKLRHFTQDEKPANATTIQRLVRPPSQDEIDGRLRAYCSEVGFYVKKLVELEVFATRTMIIPKDELPSIFQNPLATSSLPSRSGTEE